MTPVSKSTVATGTAGLALLIPASMGLFFSNGPTILCPFPALTIIPAFLLLDLHLWKVAVVVPILFSSFGIPDYSVVKQEFPKDPAF